MGGCVTVVLREPSGVTHKMLRWTNPLPAQLTDPRLFSADPSGWIEDFNQAWKNMAEDYQAHKRDGQFEYNMTSVYFPWDEAVPSEYGLICIDLKRKTILSMQDFCEEPVCIGLYGMQLGDRSANVKALIDAKVISKLHVREGGKWQSFEIPKGANKTAAFEEIVRLAKTGKVDGYLQIEPPGFTVKGFSKTLDGALALKQAMGELGHEFSRKETKLWAEWIDRFLDHATDEETAVWKAKFRAAPVADESESLSM